MLYYVKLAALSIKTISRTLNSSSFADINSLVRCATPAPEVRRFHPEFDDLNL